MWPKSPTRSPIFSSCTYLYTEQFCHRGNLYPLDISWDLPFVFRVHNCHFRVDLLRLQGCALVGLGSIFFHATLLYEAQLADELPMIYVASFFLAVLLESEPGFGFKSTYSKFLVAAIVIFDVVFTAS